MERVMTTNGKIDPVYLAKYENGWVCLKENWLSKLVPADFNVCSYDVIFKQVLELWRQK